MIYSYAPSLPLADYVHTFWYCEDDEIVHTHEFVLPHGRFELVISLTEDPLCVFLDGNQIACSHALMSGVQRHPFVISTRSRQSTIGVCFKPGGVYHFLDFPVDELAYQHVRLDDLYGQQLLELQEPLLHAAGIEQRFRVLEQFLFRSLRDSIAFHPAVTSLLGYQPSTGGRMSINEFSQQVGLSTRRFIELFKAQVGVTPKQCQRIIRFQSVLQRINSGTEINWASLAVQFGYHDQPHMINDFKLLSGMTPGAYLAVHTSDQNHVPA